MTTESDLLMRNVTGREWGWNMEMILWNMGMGWTLAQQGGYHWLYCPAGMVWWRVFKFVVIMLNNTLILKSIHISIAAVTWWCHQMEIFFALLAFCVGNSPVPGEFPTQRPVTRSFAVFFDLCLNKWLSKQWWGWWFEMPSRSLWRHCNGNVMWSLLWCNLHIFTAIFWN